MSTQDDDVAAEAARDRNPADTAEHPNEAYTGDPADVLFRPDECWRCLEPAHPDDGGCQHGSGLCGSCGMSFCDSCQQDAADARAELTWRMERDQRDAS